MSSSYTEPNHQGSKLKFSYIRTYLRNISSTSHRIFSVLFGIWFLQLAYPHCVTQNSSCERHWDLTEVSWCTCFQNTQTSTAKFCMSRCLLHVPFDLYPKGWETFRNELPCSLRNLCLCGIRGVMDDSKVGLENHCLCSKISLLFQSFLFAYHSHHCSLVLSSKELTWILRNWDLAGECVHVHSTLFNG